MKLIIENLINFEEINQNGRSIVKASIHTVIPLWRDVRVKVHRR